MVSKEFLAWRCTATIAILGPGLGMKVVLLPAWGCEFRIVPPLTVRDAEIDLRLSQMKQGVASTRLAHRNPDIPWSSNASDTEILTGSGWWNGLHSGGNSLVFE
ncbi:hypothetical protein [Scleromatobacter humisilvae]|uniref:Uncharacterized protein n=1 Tax=Scleromatobacter humisilvae TaxID=2897159 RepID=A0A9X1YKJ0_9BURK|nr:hypothetical protein [Scleromatobacter humisilvae]MCK9687417.1 hypothetical protein [Scleromatobacter humisilvae]